MAKIPTPVGDNKNYLVLSRKKFTNQSIIGKLFFRSVAGGDKKKAAECTTLELAWKNNKRSESCIPPGIYPLKYKKHGGFLNRYKKNYGHVCVLLVCDVPGRSDILVHIGNSAKDTRGCILVGRPSRTRDFIGSSVNTYKQFYRDLMAKKPKFLIVEQPVTVK